MMNQGHLSLNLFILAIFIFPVQIEQIETAKSRNLASENHKEKFVFPSAFDLVIAEKNHGKIPSRIEELAQIFGNVNEDLHDTHIDFPAIGTLVPYGRSIQRAKSNFIHPRILYAFYTEYGPTYLGFSEESERAEIISWVPNLRKFRFEIIKNIKTIHKWVNKKNKIHAPMGVCMQCHQAGGPIFPRAPWREMVEASILNGLTSVHKKKHYHQIKIEDSISALTIRANIMDNMVRYGNFLLQAGTALNQVCDKDRLCQKTLIKIALNQPIWGLNPFDYLKREGEKLRNLLQILLSNSHQAVLPDFKQKNLSWWKQKLKSGRYYSTLKNILARRWPKNKFAYPSSTLPDRRFMGTNLRGNQKVSAIQIPYRFSDNQEEATFDDSISNFVFTHNGPVQEEFPNQIIDQTSTEVSGITLFEKEIFDQEQAKGLANPRTIRPLTQKIESQDAALYMSLIATLGFSFTYLEVAELKRPLRINVSPHRGSIMAMQVAVDENNNQEEFVLSKLNSAIDSTQFDQILEFFEQMPPKDVILSGLSAILNNQEIPWPSYKHMKLSRQQEHEELIESVQEISKKNTIKKHCISCHAKDDEYPLPLDNKEELRNYRGKSNDYKGQSIQHIIEEDFMPLDGALSADEKEEVINYLNTP